MLSRLDGITRKNEVQRGNRDRSGVFRDALYSYGKRAGTVKVLPGVKNTGVGNFLQNSRKKVYPVARSLGNFQAIKAGNFISGAIGRLGRIGTGAISGRLIDRAVRPMNLSPFFARQARVALGKQLSRDTKLDRAFKDIVDLTITGKVRINQKAANDAVKRNTEIHKEAQLLLNMIDVKLRAYAPDVSSGQYMLGTEDNRFSEGKKILNESAMMNEQKFERMGIKNFQGGNQFKFRDIFGFERPGEARAFLLSSIDKDNVFRSKRGQNDFFYGEINVGGSPLFPWIHAVEYGGKLPYYKRGGYKKQGYEDHFMDANLRANNLGEDIVNLNKGEPANKYVPDFKYVPPTMFIYRSAADALAGFKKEANLNYLGDIDDGSTRYYKKWEEIAKGKIGTNAFFKDETSFTRPTNTKDLIDTQYRMDQESSRRANFWSRMENKIPGPRVEMGHGNFYSQELAAAIGLQSVPEEFKFSFNVMDITADGGQPHSYKFLSELAKTYVESGGSKENIIKKLQQRLEYDTHQGNYFKKSRPSAMKTVGPEGLKRFKKITGKRNLKVGDTVFANTKQSRREAERLYGYFSATGSKKGSVSRGERGAKYIRNMYEFDVRREGKKRVVYSRLKKDKGSPRRGEVDRSALNNLSKTFLSDLEVDEIYKRASDLDF